LDKSKFNSDEILIKYKEQQAAERGFSFLKDPLFFADSVFLKTPKRIETMAMCFWGYVCWYILWGKEKCVAY
jgi:transposase